MIVGDGEVRYRRTMANAVWRFGPFTLDERRGELRHGSETVDVMPKVFTLLVYLVRHRDRLLTKEELLDAIWPDTHVAEGSLARTITNLRQALGDHADEPLYVETVARRGYRFVAAVEESAAAAASPFCLVHEQRVYPLTFGENLLGRDPHSAVPIASAGVSRRHATITVTATTVTLADVGSKNGTMVSGQRIAEPVPLHEGDEIRLGPLLFVFTSKPAAQSTVTEISGV